MTKNRLKADIKEGDEEELQITALNPIDVSIYIYTKEEISCYWIESVTWFKY